MKCTTILYRGFSDKEYLSLSEHIDEMFRACGEIHRLFPDLLNDERSKGQLMRFILRYLTNALLMQGQPFLRQLCDDESVTLVRDLCCVVVALRKYEAGMTGMPEAIMLSAKKIGTIQNGESLLRV